MKICHSAWLLAAALSGAFLAAESTNKVLARYNENMERIASIRGTMIQEVKRGDSYSYMKGEYCSKGIKLYLKVSPPHDFLLVSNGKRAIFYFRQENTVYLYDPEKYPQEYQNPAQQQQKILEHIPELELIGTGYVGWKKMAIYEGKNLDPEQFVSKVKIWLDPGSGLLFRMEVFDLHGKLVNRMEMQKYQEFKGIWLNLRTLGWSQGEREIVETVSEYREIEINGVVEDALFEFPIPQGAKVKDLTEQILGKKKE